ncbi:hypothetical protein K8T06_00250, partial [bacterium]|nr:hypothetical protein [bacterium]
MKNVFLFCCYVLILPAMVFSSGNDLNTVLMIHSNDADGSTEFVDSAIGASESRLFTLHGDTHHEADVFKFGISSVYFDGVEDLLTLS